MDEWRHKSWGLRCGTRSRRLRETVLLGSLLCLLTCAGAAWPRPAAPRLRQQVEWSKDASRLTPAELPAASQSYRIEARLDPATRTVHGELRLRWTNPADHPVYSVPLHLYLNAFSHEHTTWMEEASLARWANMRELSRSHEQPWGWLELERIEQLPPELTGDDDGAPCSLRFIQPDDDNPLDQSLAEVSLPEPVDVGGQLRLEIAFVAHLPVPIARTGGIDDYFHVGQWYPKIGVYEPAGVGGRVLGGWAVRQFHGTTEFYAPFADYDVTIEVPEDFSVVATGEGQTVPAPEPGRARTRFVQPAVIDFAFVAGRRLHVESHPYDPRGGGSTIDITYVTPSGTGHQVGRMRTAAEQTFDVLGSRVGPYPFSTMTVVQPPWGAIRTAGMEYPTLVTGMPGDPLADVAGLDRLRLMEGTIAHEIIHNYFQGIVATDEQRVAFLDEGFTSYWDGEVKTALAKGDPAYSLFVGHPFDSLLERRMSLAKIADEIDEPIIKQPSNLFYPRTWRAQIYTRSALTFTTAARLFGQQEVDRVFWQYFHRHRFGHPTTGDFFATVDQVASAGLRGFLHEAFTAPRIPDYRVEEATTEPWRPPIGRVPTADGSVVVTGSEDEGDESKGVGLDPSAHEKDGQVMMVVLDPGTRRTGDQRDGQVERRLVSPVQRRGKGDFEVIDGTFYRSTVRLRGPAWRHLPADVQFIFADGVVIRDHWDGLASWRAYRFTRPAPLSEVRIDPDDKLVVDVRPGNNGRRIEADYTVASDWGQWLTFVAQWLGAGGALWL